VGEGGGGIIRHHYFADNNFPSMHNVNKYQNNSLKSNKLLMNSVKHKINIFLLNNYNYLYKMSFY
jgi:hypothetical protein